MNRDVDAAVVRAAVDLVMAAVRQVPVIADIVALSVVGVAVLVAVVGTVAGVRRQRRKRREADPGPSVRTSPFAARLVQSEDPLDQPMRNPWSG